MLEQVRNLVVIKISVVTLSVALFILMLKIIFMCVKIVAHPQLMPHCGIIWVHIANLDFRHENNSTPVVLIKEIRYIAIYMCARFDPKILLVNIACVLCHNWHTRNLSVQQFSWTADAT